MRTLATTALFLSLLGWTAAADDPKDAAKKLEGTYDVVSVIVAGKPDPMKDEVKGVVIKDGQIIVKTKRDDPAKFTLDPSKTPAHIDISPSADMTMPGIYETKETDKGTELTIVFRPGPKAERPKDFKGEGKEDVVLKLFRKKEK